MSRDRRYASSEPRSASREPRRSSSEANARAENRNRRGRKRVAASREAKVRCRGPGGGVARTKRCKRGSEIRVLGCGGVQNGGDFGIARGLSGPREPTSRSTKAISTRREGPSRSRDPISPSADEPSRGISLTAPREHASLRSHDHGRRAVRRQSVHALEQWLVTPQQCSPRFVVLEFASSGFERGS
jgi:hypothetical protein